ncbi:hypothetical protein TcasGA2_TC032362 [Tribolium castaneum]|uniref:Uncharacterized protein n=1 Tax=Tribolium castaneum TaxID=7070 RepID=A0A139WLZ9_TRICA|nr:hypothetical protein TcasGA2_TC032362 [Tribolium castaneum]
MSVVGRRKTLAACNEWYAETTAGGWAIGTRQRNI